MSVKQRVEEELGIGEKTPIKMTIDGHSAYPSVNIEIIDAEALLSLIEAVEKMEAIKAQGIDKFVELHEALNEVWAALKAVTE